MANKIEELRKDIVELERLTGQSTRQRVKDILGFETRKLVSEVMKLEEQNNVQPTLSPITTTSTSSNTNKRYEIKLSNYAWDQNAKFVKFYVTLQKVHTIPSDNVVCKFTSKSVELSVKDLDNKDYAWRMNNLLKTVVPDQSSWKIKSDMVIISVAKQEPDNWSHVTEWEKKASDSQKLSTDAEKSGDPTDGLMSMMKNMYDKGDDEMKRTIAKAWTESQMNKPAM